jgi:hypothetical protein
LTLVALLVVVAIGLAAVAVTRVIAAEKAATRRDAARTRAVALMAAFAPALQAAQQDPRALLVWEPLARTARKLAPDDMASLDRAAGSRFPFSTDTIQAAHAKWSADWLAWEALHDAEYKRKASEAAHDGAALDAVEREKLDRYQRRYHEYVTVSKALQALLG